MFGKTALSSIILVNCILYAVDGKTVQAHRNFRDADQDEILKGITEFTVSGTIGLLSVFGLATTTIISGQFGSNLFPIVAVGNVDNSRILGFAHTSFLNPESATPTDPAAISAVQLILNSVRWAGWGDSPSVGITGASDVLFDLLTSNSIPVTHFSLDDIQDASQLLSYNVICISSQFDESKVKILNDYAALTGGGVILALTAWAYNPLADPFGSTYPPNTFVSQAGFVWTYDYSGGPTLPNGNYNASTQLTLRTNVQEAWTEIRGYLSSEGDSSNLLTHQKQFQSIFEAGIKFMPRPSEFFDEQLYTFAKDFTSDSTNVPIATEQNPVIDELDKFLLKMYNLFAVNVLQPPDIPVYPGAKYFPGDPLTLTPSPRSPLNRVNQEIQIEMKKFPTPNQGQLRKQLRKTLKGSPNLSGLLDDHIDLNTTHSRWFSTGLYAVAGQAVTVTIQNFTSSSEEVEVTLKDFGVRIGCHQDDISHFDEWFRPPSITIEIRFPDTASLDVASPYGGLLYIVGPDREIDVTLSASVSGAIKAPYFQLGKTHVTEWRDSIRFESGPWAEFETDSLVITVPSLVAQKVDDPEQLLIVWSNIMDAMADLAVIDRVRYRQERFVPDVQIGGGYMHSGYPIMTFLDVASLSVNLTQLRIEGSWGHLHELGHNHQNGLWTFEGTGEVTCNLFALYVCHTVLALEDGLVRDVLRPEVYIPLVQKYIENGMPFNEFQSDADLALLHYYQLQQFYGWTAFKESFGQYHNLEDGDEPETTEEKIDLWMVIFSKVVGHNLVPFFESWGIPVSEEAAEIVGQLEETPIRLEDFLKGKVRK